MTPSKDNASPCEEKAGANKAMRPTDTHFHRGEQAGHLLIEFLGRWLITATVCGAFVGVIKAYDKRDYLERNNTNVYNSLTAGLTIILSLNLDSSLNAFAGALKWVALAHCPSSLEVSNLLLAFDASKINAIKLLWHGQWKLRAICVVWLFIALAAQVSTALIGLTYGVGPLSLERGNFPIINGNGRTAIFTNIGFVNTIDHKDTEPENTLYNLTSQRSAAFAYGVGAISSPFIGLRSEDDFYSIFHGVTFDTTTREYINGISNYPEWSKDTRDWNCLERRAHSMVDCELLRITNVTTSDDKTFIKFNNYNISHILSIPMAPLDYTTYISDTNQTCGARCTRVYAIFSTEDDLDVFLCNSTVGLMYEFETDELVSGAFSLPDTQARILAGGIGWGDLDIEGYLDGISVTGRFQGSSFPNGSFWAPSRRPDEYLISDYFIARFTALTFSVMDEYGPYIQSGDLRIPGQASQLDVKWRYVTLVLTLIPGLQAVLALVSIFIIYYFRIPVHDDSPLAMAALLAPIVSNAPIGSLQSGTEMARTINKNLIYTFTEDDDGGRYQVEVDTPESWNGRKTFRDGLYR